MRVLLAILALAATSCFYDKDPDVEQEAFHYARHGQHCVLIYKAAGSGPRSYMSMALIPCDEMPPEAGTQ